MIDQKIILALITIIVSTVQGQNTCPLNEEFVIDIYRCDNTCKTYGRTFDCGDTYEPHGRCYCKNGFARVTEGGSCVSIQDPACASKLPTKKNTCGNNEVFYEHLYSRHFLNGKDSCKYLKVIPNFVYPDLHANTAIRPMKWGPHCECKKGYARLNNGNCVAKDSPQCLNQYKPSQAQCRLRGEVFVSGPSCQEYCNSNPICDSSITEDCKCPTGTLRLNTYQPICIMPQDCPDPPA